MSRNVVRTIAVLMSATVVATTGYFWWTVVGDLDAHTVTTDVFDDRPGDQESANRVTLDKALNILLVGMDSRKDSFGNPLPKEALALLNGGKDEGERNTDTMILLHIPAGGKRAVAFSFPRDSYVDIGPGFGKRKLNSAFINAYVDARQTLADQGVTDQKELEDRATVAGRKNLISVIQRLTGGSVVIDRYAEVNLASFYEVTKAVGGVDVCLKNPVDDVKSGAHFPAGRQTISGAAALSFVRQRYGLPNGDLDRIVRQQVFLGALANKILSADILTSPSRARDLVTAVQKSVVLSSNWNLTTFAAQMQSLSSGNIEFHTIPTQGLAKIGGADVVKIDPDQVATEIKNTFASADGGTTPPPMTRPTDADPDALAPPTTGSPAGNTATGAGITVDVRNGTTTRGLATTVLDLLAGHGFTRGQTGDAAVQQSSIIRYPAGELAEAKSVANTLSSGTFSFAEDRTLTKSHIRVVLGTSYPKSDGQQLTGSPLMNLAPPPSTSQTTTTSPATNAPPATIEAGKLNCVN
ncbi:LCP family protein [Actinokineospora enzanensis]|uniref:LCP family protein n=1 Tax=Actinokineospora enzanensis TaxID=155975 RepID=UPI00035D9D32|nr:LCP family protein [Actinokineospora enzanensis]